MRPELVHRKACRLRRLDVCDRVAERERDLLGRGRAGLPNVIPGDRDRVPVRQRPAAVSEEIGDESHRRLRRKDVRPPCRVLLEDVVLHRARDLFRRAALLLGHELVQQQQHRGGGVDGHRGRHLFERDVLEQDLHVLERVDRDADLADLAIRHRVVRVVADLRRQVEGYGESGLALLEQEPVPLVRFRRRAEPGVLAHRPQAAAVHVLVNATRERELARKRILGAPVLDRVHRPDRQATVVFGIGHFRGPRELTANPLSSWGSVSTNSVSTPPMLLGWTNAMRLPCRPIRGSASISSRPASRAPASATSMSSTPYATWCRPGPRLAMNLPTGESTRSADMSSISPSPTRSSTASRPSVSLAARWTTSAPSEVR